MNTVLAGICGVVVCLGVAAVVRGLVGTTRPPAPRRVGRRLDLGRAETRRLAAGLVAGLVVWALSGWAVAVVLAPLLVAGVPHLLGEPPQREVELLAALDRWVRGLAAVLPTGRSITDAVRASRRTAPPLLAEPLARVVVRLDERWSTPDALAAMADELDSPSADAVLAALMLASQRGGTGAAASLQALSESISERLRALRDIETERAKPRIVVRQVTLVSGVMIAAALLLGRDFFAPYATPLGQVVLGALAAAYLGALAMMRRVATPRPRERILRAEVVP